MKIIKGCPICEGNVFGTKETGYYCKHCNLLFESRHISFKNTRDELKRKIAHHFSGFEGKLEKKEKQIKEQEEIIIPKRTVTSREQLKEDSTDKGMRAVESLRKIDGYGVDEDKPAILQFIDDHLKKFKEHQETASKKAAIRRKNTKKTNSKKTTKKKVAKKKTTRKKK